MSAFAHSHTKLNMTIGKAHKVGKASTSTRVSSKLAILKEQDLRKFLLVKGVEKKLHVVKELVVQEAMLRLKQQQATTAAQVKFAMGPVAPPAGKLVVSDVVAVEVHVAAANHVAASAPKVIHNKHSAGNANGLPPLPPSANVATPLVFTTNEEPQSFSFDPSPAADGSSRSGGLRRDRRRPSDDDSSERIIIADSFGTTSIQTPLASLNLGNGGNDGTGNNGLASSSSYATVVNVGPQYFVGAFGEEMKEMSRSMPEMSEWFTGTTTTTTLTTTSTTVAKEETQRFAAGSAAMAAAVASSAAPPARAAAAADEAATTSTAFDGLLGQRLLRGFGGLDLLLDADSSSSSSSLVSQEQQQQQTAATTESWHHWQASTVDVTEEQCEKPDSKDKKEKKKDDGLKSKDVLQFGLLVADALCNVLAASQALAGLVLLASAQLQQQQEQQEKTLSARCAPRREEEEEVAPRQSALLVC